MGDDEDGLNNGFWGGMGPGAMNVDLSEPFAWFHGNSAFGGGGGRGVNHHSFGGGTNFDFSGSVRWRGVSY
jgi:hypothetical protein